MYVDRPEGLEWPEGPQLLGGIHSHSPSLFAVHLCASYTVGDGQFVFVCAV